MKKIAIGIHYLMRVASLYRGIFRAATMNADRIPRDLVRRRSHDNTHFGRARTRSSAAIRGSGLAPSAGADYPAKAVRLVVPLPAGGATDVIARAVSQRLS